MSEGNTTSEEKTEETTTEEAPAEEPVVEAEPEPTPEPKSTGSAELTGSIATGKQVYSGACKLCGARMTSTVADTEGKVRCATCNGTF